MVNKQGIDFLFIHHSCGGQLLAAAGPNEGSNCIYKSHPNGGGLRARLEQNSYSVHEASYGSRIGDKTDLFDWLPKFRNQMQDILACDSQDAVYGNGRRNRVVAFKSCFPNNAFKSKGQTPGNPAGPELTLRNAQTAYTALLGEFQKYPDTLFICVTAPPLAPQPAHEPIWKSLAKKALGRGNGLAESGRLAREFNNWLANDWLKESRPANVAVFNYYGILTGNGESGLSQYPTGSGIDSHPSREGNERAAEAFIPFLNQAIKRAGLNK